MTYAALEDQKARGGSVGDLSSMHIVLEQRGLTEINKLAVNTTEWSPPSLGGGYGARVFKYADGTIVLVDVGSDFGQRSNTILATLSQAMNPIVAGFVGFSEDGATSLKAALGIPTG